MLVKKAADIKGWDNPLAVIDQSLLDEQSHGDRGDPLGRRPAIDQRIGLPLGRQSGIGKPAPQVNHTLAATIGAAGAPQLAPLLEVPDERIPHRLETAADMSVDVLPRDGRRFCECHAASDSNADDLPGTS